ncbi:hypothetical protein AADZ84_05080 [Colwelliaceae bacterium MEBiC 14330]
MSNSINKTNLNNRRMIMSASLLNTYHENVKSVYSEDNIVDGYNKQHSDQQNDQEDNNIYVLGYN